MVEAVARPETPARARQVSVAAIVWVVAGLAFVALRIGTVWHAPVAGPELIHLSGAWQARIGDPDARFIPTLFQALAALALRFSTSEVGPRLVALVATAMIPLALYLLRGRLGQGGALLALVLLALDAPGVTLGTAASAMAFDLAIALWLVVVITKQSLPPWLYAAVGFGVATAGPLALALVAAWAAVRLLRRDYPEPLPAAFCTAGVVAGILAATFRFGLGADGGLRVPPFDLFAASFDQAWSSALTIEIGVLYSLPILGGGLAAVAVAGWRMYRAREAQPDGLILLAWTLFALAWFLGSSRSHGSVPLVALTTPLALILGPALVEAVGAMARADWRYARFLIPAGLLALAVALSFSLDWARDSKVGDGPEQLLVAGLCLAGLSALGIVASARASMPALFGAVLAVAALPVLSGAFGVGFGAGGEPEPSPVSPAQARQLRAIALDTVAERGGTIVVHSDLAGAVTWPFRDSGSIVVASRVPADAMFLVWPSIAPPPEGFAPLAGEWHLMLDPEAPLSGFLAYLKWFTSHESLDINSASVAVYVRARQ